MKRRVVAAILASVLALAGVAMIALYVRNADARAMRKLDPVEVFVVTQEIPKGQAVELGTNIDVARLPRVAVAPGVVTNLATLNGLVADTTLHPGEQLFSSRFTTPEALTNDEVTVPEELVQITIKLAPERLLGGELKAGNTVGVDLSWVDTNSVHYTYPFVHKILVTRVADAETQPSTDESAPPQAPGTKYVTLAVSNTQADRIIWAAEHGTVWLTLERENSKTDDGKLIVWGDPNGEPPVTVPTSSASAESGS
ncbi:Flp pilus assembly protein CpaB [Aestuariimicrobium soli]|uniref:Flp pilus assembly protein CpaB n=1 Tax=Aestuariimicrobium soli TaxID=2035834 RepID=UPI003EBF83A3